MALSAVNAWDDGRCCGRGWVAIGFLAIPEFCLTVRNVDGGADTRRGGSGGATSVVEVSATSPLTDLPAVLVETASREGRSAASTLWIFRRARRSTGGREGMRARNAVSTLRKLSIRHLP